MDTNQEQSKALIVCPCHVPAETFVVIQTLAEGSDGRTLAATVTGNTGDGDIVRCMRPIWVDMIDARVDAGQNLGVAIPADGAWKPQESAREECADLLDRKSPHTSGALSNSVCLSCESPDQLCAIPLSSLLLAMGAMFCVVTAKRLAIIAGMVTVPFPLLAAMAQAMCVVASFFTAVSANDERHVLHLYKASQSIARGILKYRGSAGTVTPLATA